MRWKISLTILILSVLACTAPGTPLPPTESASELGAEAPTETLAPYSGDTPSPPTIPAPVVTAPYIISLHMLSELSGWAITDTAILRTTDGGSTWYNVSPQDVTGFGYGTANSFLNVTQAWIMVADANDPGGSGVLYKTIDGGLSWTVNPVPFGSGEMEFVDDNHGWMMSYLGIAAGSMAVAIYQTEDGGSTWIQTYTNHPQQDGSDSLPFGGIKSGLVALDMQTAWVSGVIYAPETFYFYRTVDGGTNWALQNLPTAPGMQNTDISIDLGPIFTSPQDAMLPVRFTGETYRTGFYATHDSGENWEFVSFMPGAGTVDFVSLSDGFFWTGEQFFMTVDGAHTWTTVNSNMLFGETFAGMDFINPYTGWVWTYSEGDQKNLYKTTDGGSTWFLMGE